MADTPMADTPGADIRCPKCCAVLGRCREDAIDVGSQTVIITSPVRLACRACLFVRHWSPTKRLDNSDRRTQTNE